MILGTKLTRALVNIDYVCDHIPVVSTVNNLVDIFEKCVIQIFCKTKSHTKSIDNNHYFSYLKEKSIWRCIGLLVPIFGNMVLAIVDFGLRLDQDDIAESMDLNVNDLPRNPNARKLIMNKKKCELVESGTKDYIDALQCEIDELKKLKKGFKRCHKNFTDSGFDIDAHRTIERDWSGFIYGRNGDKVFTIRLRLQWGFYDRIKEIEKDPIFIRKNKEYSDLKNKILDYRTPIYRDYIKKLTDQELVKMAQKSFNLDSLANNLPLVLFELKEIVAKDAYKKNMRTESNLLEGVIFKAKEIIGEIETNRSLDSGESVD